MRRASLFPLTSLLSALLLAGWANAQDATPPTPEPAAATSALLPAVDSNLGQPFATKHATFEPRAFSELPGWQEDDLREAASGMEASCSALQRKPVWANLCGAFAQVGNDPAQLHAFFERNFYAYQMMSSARVPTGKLTGYFEPLLDGSSRRDERFRYPVYGMPQDLLLLDARSVGGGSAWLRREGNRLRRTETGATGAREYALELGSGYAGVRDKRYRVRIEGNRVLPYYSRQDIERRAISAPVLAWVEDAHKLYSMQIQGSGKIRLREGGLVRVAYAEQNGHPFRPRVTRGVDEGVALAQIKARGLVSGSSAAATMARPNARVSAPVNAEVAALIAALKGTAPPVRPPSVASATPSSTSRPLPPPPRPLPSSAATGSDPRDREVAALISALKGEGPAPAPRPVTSSNNASVATVDNRPVFAPSGRSEPREPTASAGTAVSDQAGGATNIPDPSYVFFRAIGDGPEGPIGALGVPLSAERSVAIDPRTTPLGAPVFISSIQPGGEGPMRKLMFAQDTGGAIRGSVRADFFWGFGDDAGRLALATNEVLQMWLLLPRQQQISAVAASGMKLRGAKVELPECVIADEELCVE